MPNIVCCRGSGDILNEFEVTTLYFRSKYDVWIGECDIYDGIFILRAHRSL